MALPPRGIREEPESGEPGSPGLQEVNRDDVLVRGQLAVVRDRHTDQLQRNPHHSGHGHGWMMLICCFPMLMIAAILVATGVVGAGYLLVAIACVAIMALMMRAMGPGDG